MDKTSKPILVVGATGRHGGTGRIVADALLDSGQPIRIITRKIDDRIDSLRARGADVFQADLHDRLSTLAALDGVETAYFTYPIAGGVIDAAANFAGAARETGLKRLVTMSMGPAHPKSPSHLGRAQWLAEQIFEWAGFNCLHLRIAAAFLENIEMLHGREIQDEGVIRNAFPDIKVSWILGEDAARVAAAALLTPEKFAQGPAIYPGSPYQYTQSEIAKIVGGFLGKPVRFEAISVDMWRDRIIGLARSDDRLNADMAAHISAIAGALHVMPALPPNDMIEAITGRVPQGLLEALETGRLVLDRPQVAAI
ncbi:MAG: hypothetical protein BVN33_18020 [Proteobacteria bacterium ST_bin13]|nr:MAG: hypothetical protein BVN33_18020 [Proteobacteria bacterium ST_bin13]